MRIQLLLFLIFLLEITLFMIVMLHFQSIENNLEVNYFETINLSDEIKNDFLKAIII